MAIKHVGKMTVAAHRGDCYNYHENTMTAFEKALQAGADMIETDVHLTKDNILIIMHDDTVNRTTDGEGYIKDMTLSEILKLNAGDEDYPEKVPVFDDFMKWAAEKNTMVNIEIKEYYSPENEERCKKCIEDIVSIVEKYNMADRILFNSFDAWVLEYVYKKYGKKYMLHGFYPYTKMKNVSLNPDEYLYCACIFDTLNKELYNYLKERNIEPWIGASVTQESVLNIAVRYGARLVTTNNPANALEKLQRLGLREAE
ncbi:MAG: hypothetical protein J6A69_04515 [Clostridia bacterium]|nr:hypothetical protein [Clostridia bacterium]